MIQYKNDEVLKGILSHGWHPTLIEVYMWIIKAYRESVTITCGHETRDYISTHDVDPLRAFDIRSWCFADPQKVEDAINQAWEYDPERPEMLVAKCHDTGRGIHFHIQVHDNTIKREAK